MEIHAASIGAITYRGLLRFGRYPDERAIIEAAIREVTAGRERTEWSAWTVASYPVSDGIVYVAYHRPSSFIEAGISAVEIAGRIRQRFTPA